MLCQSLSFDVFIEIKIQCQIVSSSLTKKEFTIIILLWSLTYIFIIEQTNKMNFNTLFKMDLNWNCTLSVLRTFVQSKEMFRREFISAWQVNGQEKCWQLAPARPTSKSSIHWLFVPLFAFSARAQLLSSYTRLGLFSPGKQMSKNAFSYWGISGASTRVSFNIACALEQMSIKIEKPERRFFGDASESQNPTPQKKSLATGAQLINLPAQQRGSS